MGGYGSGRKGYLITTKVDDGLSLNINKLVRGGQILKSGSHAGTVYWTKASTGEKTSSIGYESNTLNPDDMWLRIHYTCTIEGKEYEMDYKIILTTTQPHYGGKRFWFECPLTKRRTSVLHSPPGSKWFACRHAFGLQYQSQSLDELSRANEKVYRIKRKLGGEKYYFKPKGMHQKTYDRLLRELYKAEEVAKRLFIEGAVKILKRPWG